MLTCDLLMMWLNCRDTGLGWVCGLGRMSAGLLVHVPERPSSQDAFMSDTVPPPCLPLSPSGDSSM